jgi:defect-in-organelle-trafficking protein DotD
LNQQGGLLKWYGIVFFVVGLIECRVLCKLKNSFMERIMRKLVRCAVLSVVFLLAGCQSSHGGVYSVPNIKDDPAGIALAEAAVSVSQSLNEMSEIKRASTPTNKRMVSDGRYNIAGKVSIDWSGPIEPILAKLARVPYPAYHFRVVGRKPAIPVVVTLNAHETLLCDVLRDMDFQASDRASIRVSAQSRVLELRYETLSSHLAKE